MLGGTEILFDYIVLGLVYFAFCSAAVLFILKIILMFFDEDDNDY